MNYMLRTLVLAALAGLGYLGYEKATSMLDDHQGQILEREARIEQLAGQLDEQQETISSLEGEVAAGELEIAQLETDVAERDEQIDELDTAMRFLKIDHRLARLTVLDQATDASGAVETAVRFEELGSDGQRLGEAAEYSLPGKVAYVESLVIKFDDDYVEQGDVWRGTSICLFRRLFSEQQSPDEGYPLDQVGERPLPYTDDRAPGLVDKLWMRFWDYANNAQSAADAGVRAIHGEAPFIELRPGATYLVELRSSGGLSLRRE
jgi:hypothetical protein